MEDNSQQSTDQGNAGATIDPPAADTAKRSRERRDALLQRLEEEKEFRVTQKDHLVTLLQEHDSNMQNAKLQTSGIPTA